MPDISHKALLAAAVIVVGCVAGAQPAAASTAYAVTTDGKLITFDTASPGTIPNAVAITFFPGGEPIVAIDVRPETGELIGLGSSGALYQLYPESGGAVPITAAVGSFGGTAFGFDFDPVADRARLVSSTGQNLRIDLNTGSVVTDANMSPAASVVASAYSNSYQGSGATTTTLYGIDSATDTLVLQGSVGGTPVSPNSGIVTTVGPLGVDTSGVVGFDIGVANQAFATLTVGGVSGLYTIDLATGAATLIGSFPPVFQVRGLALRRAFTPRTMYGVTGGTTLITFHNGSPETIRRSVAITGLQAGETVVGLDQNSRTLELYAVGSSSRLYVLDAATGVATAIGPGPFSAPLQGTAFGVALDSYSEIRIVSDAEQNLRVTTDGVSTESGPPLAPASSIVAATFGPVDLGEAVFNRLYGIDSATDRLVIIGPTVSFPGAPLVGTVTDVGPLGVDTSAVASLEIFNAYFLSTDDETWAALDVGGQSRLYTIDLRTGAATLIGTIGTGAPVRGLTIAYPGQFRLSAPTYYTREGDGTMTATVVRSGSTVGRTAVSFRTGFAGSADPGPDFVPTGGILVFPDGVSTASFPVSLLDDAMDELDTQFLVLLDEVVGGAPVDPGRRASLVYLVDDDAPTAAPALTITSPTPMPAFEHHDRRLTLAGTASDASGITQVTWSTDRSSQILSNPAVGTTSWTAQNIPLEPGTNVVTIRAFDGTSDSSLAVVTVTVTELRYSMAEGSTGTFFDTDILLANPHPVAVPISAAFLAEDGTAVTRALTLPALSRMTIPVDGVPGREATAFSTFVTAPAALPIGVERTTRWDATGYGAHTEKAAADTALAWYFAEGSQGFFHTFVQLANPTPASNSAEVEFLREDGTTVTRTIPLAPTSRYTLYAGDVPELVNRSFGITVRFTQPGLAERSMYFGAPLFNGGHASAGATAPSTTWTLAEGATGSFFTTFLLLANPGTTAGQVTLTYLRDTGAPVTKTYAIGAKQRLTINVALEDPSLANVAVSTRVVATVPVIAERAQYWPNTPDQWYEAHNSFGETGTAGHWILAEGRVGGPNAYQTYILIANQNTFASEARVRFLREPGKFPVTTTVTIPAQGRFTLGLPSASFPDLANETFGIEITGVGIVVERALYSDANGQVWAAGTSATGTRLP